MSNNKLFKKLNEQVEINHIKNKEITESEKTKIETKVIFENINIERIDNLNFDKSDEN